MPTSASHLRSTCNPLPPSLQHRAQEVVDLVAGCVDDTATWEADALTAGASVLQLGARCDAAETAPALPESVPRLAPTARLAQDPAAPRWPSSACRPSPVVHITIGKEQHLALDGLHAVLSALTERESSTEQGTALGICRKVEEIRSTIRFAAKAPAPDPSGAREAKVGEQEGVIAVSEVPGPAAALPGAEVEKVVLVQPDGVSVARMPGSGDAEVERPQLSTLVSVKTRKRRGRQAGVECLEDVARVAVTDPYTPTVNSELSAALEPPQASSGQPKKKKLKKRRAQDQTFVDPYL